VLLGNFVVCSDKPRHVLSLEKFRVSCGDMRQHKLGDAGAMLDFFVPVDRRESVAMRGSPFCRSDGQDETSWRRPRRVAKRHSSPTRSHSDLTSLEFPAKSRLINRFMCDFPMQKVETALFVQRLRWGTCVTG
jgi:hypothetical protein